MSTHNSVPGKGAAQIVADARKTVQEITVVQASGHSLLAAQTLQSMGYRDV